MTAWLRQQQCPMLDSLVTKENCAQSLLHRVYMISWLRALNHTRFTTLKHIQMSYMGLYIYIWRDDLILVCSWHELYLGVVGMQKRRDKEWAVFTQELKMLIGRAETVRGHLRAAGTFRARGKCMSLRSEWISFCSTLVLWMWHSTSQFVKHSQLYSEMGIGRFWSLIHPWGKVTIFLNVFPSIQEHHILLPPLYVLTSKHWAIVQSSSMSWK